MTKWLYPGMFFKRWLFLALLGCGLLLTGVTLVVYSFTPYTGFFLEKMINNITGQSGMLLPSMVIMVAGAGLMVYGLCKAMYSVISAVTPGGDKLVDVIYHRRRRKKGPRIVVIGGGTGTPVLLRGLKKYTDNLTAIVTMADDGGSSGRLRDDLDILPPGDIRNCLVALADREPLAKELMQYRFAAGELKGHSLGNLVLAAMCDITGGFDRAVHRLSRMLAVRGRVIPATLTNVRLCAEMEDGSVVCGQSKIPQSGKKIRRVFLEPGNCYPIEDALQAIEEADAIIMGPGSLYSSVMPGLMVQGISEAIARARAAKIYICNVMTQPGETNGYSASQHLHAILKHAGAIVDYAVVNTETVPAKLVDWYNREGAAPVVADLEAINALGVTPISGELLQEGGVVRHHPDRLAHLLIGLINGYHHQPKHAVYINNYLQPKHVAGE
ncbi:Gluconeogenesis factor [Sporotomaculum syntrophicum]|uniref:Putative gluconeogenesis factor n=1 Tax=Sporotomaculum syntrophicum TaxID=182264 RepID=A0A9D2WP97_9FIRM|nr:gluconeogenesis factor YvcK family protein [Sporotomaculum syntrophicum]KAF1085065.1 Gluconeogenesis factor [Sporotomaculum syntrophicum]